MKEFIINQIAPTINTILVTAITAILVFVVKKMGAPTTQLLITKKKEAEIKLKDTGHESELKHSLEVWKVVDDKFRITENATALFGSKEKLFEQLLLDRIPGLTQKNIDDLRDAVSGEVNQGRKVLIKDGSQLQLDELNAKYEALTSEKNNLQSKLDNITTYVNSEPNTVSQIVTDSSENVKSE